MQLVMGFQNKPGAAQQGIGHDQAQSGKNRERGNPVERAAGVASIDHWQSVPIGAPGYTLKTSGGERTENEGLVPTLADAILRKLGRAAVSDRVCQLA